MIARPSIYEGRPKCRRLTDCRFSISYSPNAWIVIQQIMRLNSALESVDILRKWKL